MCERPYRIDLSANVAIRQTVTYPMRATLSDDQFLMLELIADKPMAALPEIARYTNPLAAARLIELTADAKWQLTQLGKAMMEPRTSYWVVPLGVV
jgi:hypothetical protein